MKPKAIAEAAERIAADRIGRRQVGALPPECRPANEADAYRIQQAAHGLMTDRGQGPVTGHKIGCTTAVMQRFLDIAQPAAGGIFAPTCHRQSGTFTAANHHRLGVECEIAVTLARDLGPGDGPFTASSLADAVANAMAAIELVDDRYDDYAALGAPTLIADDFFNAGAVLGEPFPASGISDLANVQGVMRINGEDVGTGTGADIMGQPLAALAWLATIRASLWLGLRAGEYILLGSLVETRWVSPGDRIDIAVSGLGTAQAINA